MFIALSSAKSRHCQVNFYHFLLTHGHNVWLVISLVLVSAEKFLLFELALYINLWWQFWSRYNVCKRKRGVWDRILQKNLRIKTLWSNHQASFKTQAIKAYLCIDYHCRCRIETTIPVISSLVPASLLHAEKKYGEMRMVPAISIASIPIAK